jgi:hypothetical protein
VFESRRVHCSLSMTYALNQASVSIAAWTLLDFFSSGRWDAKSASYVDPETIPGNTVAIKFPWDPSIILRFLAKVALTAGYFAFGDCWRQQVDHAQARSIMNARTADLRRKITSPVRALFHDIYTDFPGEQRLTAGTYRLCCASIYR